MTNDRDEIGNNDVVISDEDMPAIFRAADRASRTAQRRYLYLVTGNLVFLIGGALLSTIPADSLAGKSSTALLGSISFGIGLFITLFIQILGYEKGWYAGRAVAESVKTIAWRYMTCAQPYDSKLTTADADLKITTELRAILHDRMDVLKVLGGETGTDEQITPMMRRVRSLGMEERIRLYLKNRIADQREWYSKRAAVNEQRGSIWFIGILLAQLLALVFAFYIVYRPETTLNLTGVFSTIAGAFLAWLQVRRHQELAQAYALATHELGLVSALAVNVTSDEDLSKFVSDSESAISREHTLWRARRDRA